MYSRGEIDFRKRLELESMSLLGMQSEEGRKYSALPLPGNRANPMPQDQNALILEAARANIKTFEILAKNVDQ
jgi:hypothetical protein